MRARSGFVLAVSAALAVTTAWVSDPVALAQPVEVAADDAAGGLVVPAADPAPADLASEPSELEPGEVAGLRTEFSSTTLGDDGVYTTEVSTAPVNVQVGDSWVPIDNDLVADGDVLTNAQGAVDVEIPSDLADGTIAVAGDAGRVEFAMDIAASVEPAATVPGTSADGTSDETTNESLPAVVEGPEATFAGVQPGVDVTYEAMVDGVKETLTLASVDAGSEFVFPVSLSAGLSMVANDAAVDVVNAAGEVAYSFLPAFMDDSAGAHSDAVTMALDGDSIVMSLDETWLSAPERVWPVLVDPTLTNNQPPSSSIQQALPTTSSHGDYLKIGSQGTGQANRALMDYDLESIFDEPVSVLDSSLKVFVESYVAGSTPISVGVHSLGQDFTTDATWNNRTTSTAWSTPGGTYNATPLATDSTVGAPGSGQDVAVFDVTAAVTSQVQRQVSSNGFLLRASNEATTGAVRIWSGNGSFGAKRPVLSIEWQPLVGRSSMWQYVDFGLGDRASLSVNVASGDLVFSQADLSMPGTGIGAQISRTYNSRSTRYGSFGQGWSDSVEPKLVTVGANVVLYSDTVLTFVPAGAGYTSPAGANATLTGNSTTGWTLTSNQSGEKLVFAANGSLTRREDRNGNQITNTYTGGYLSKVTDTQGRDITMTSAGYGEIAQITAPGGRVFDFGYVSTQLQTFTGPATSGPRPVWTYGYDSSSRLASITDPQGTVTLIAYDSRDRATSVTQASGTTDEAVFTFVYMNTGDPLQTTVTDPRSQNTVYRFDRRGQVSKVTDANGHTRDITYSPNGDAATFNGTNAVSGVSTLAYDSFNNLTSSQSPASGSGQSAATTSFTWNTTTAPYLPTTQRDPSGNCQSYAYYQNNPTTVRTGATPGSSGCANATGGNTTTSMYDGQPKTGGGTWECSTKNTRQLCAVIDAKNNTTLYAYDAAGNITTITPPTPLGATTIAVDAASRPITVTDGNAKVTRYTYDAYDRITRITYDNDTACASTATCTTFAYDGNGNLTSRVDNTGTTTFTYSLRNQPTGKDVPGTADNCTGFSGMQFRYDAKGNLVSVCDAGGSTVYGYNNASEVVSIQEPGGNCAAVPVTGACSVVGYDDASGVYQDGRRTKMTLPPSTGIVINYTYDNAGNLLTVKAKKGASTVSSMTYTYTVGTNDTNLRRSSNINGTATNYGYDASNQLCWAGTGTGICTAPPSGAQRWTYDAVGNRTQQTIGSTTTSYAYNAANQLCATVTSGTPTCPSANWTYDGNGNLTHNPTITSLVYNAKNQNTARTQSGTTTNFVYADVGNSERTAAGATAQISDILGLASESNVRYLRDPSGTVLGERITSGASAGNYYFFTDGLGSVTHIVNSSGTYVRYYGYDAWGNTSIGSGTINSNIRYANGYADTNGLTKFGARYYDPTNGRWTQQDPAGNIDGPTATPTSPTTPPTPPTQPVFSVLVTWWILLRMRPRERWWVAAQGELQLFSSGWEPALLVPWFVRLPPPPPLQG